jgi:RNA-directed DNA polymerase
LALSDTKTKIVDLADGFDFLARHYQYSDGFVYSTPSAAAVAKMEQKLRDLISHYRGGQKQLIDKINKKLVGFATYHKVTEAAQAFRHIDNVVKTLLLELCEKLHPKQTRERLIKKYFYREPDGEHVYALEQKPDVRVRRLAETILVVHLPVSTKKNPYLDEKYYEERSDDRAIMSVAGRFKPIWNRQDGRCFYCGRPILADERKALMPIDPLRPHSPKNLAYVHGYCQPGQAEFYESELEVDSPFDLFALLKRLNEGKLPPPDRKYKFQPLTEYFRSRNEAVFTLSIEDIEKILVVKLGISAHKYIDWWYRRGDRKISFCWLSNGYKIRTINLENSRIVFER